MNRFAGVALTALFSVGTAFGALQASAVPPDVPELIYGEEPGLVELYVRAWELARGRIHTTKGLPSERYMDEALWESDIWIWDSCFMAQFCKYAPQTFPGIETLDNFYAILLQDGTYRPPKVVCDNPWAENKIGELTPLSVHICDNPPLMAWAERSYVKMTGDTNRLWRVFCERKWPQRYYDFIENLRPGWRVDGIRNESVMSRTEIGYHWAGGQSGMDNTPRGRVGASSPRARPNNPDLLWVDLLAQQALAAESIAACLKILGKDDESDSWRLRYREKAGLLNSLYWSEKEGFYFDVFEKTRTFCPVMTPAGFWTMMAGCATETRASRMTERLRPGGELFCEAGVPSLSVKDADFDPSGKYWRGSMWLPMAYMTVKALERYGRFDLAREVALRTVRHQLAVYRAVEPHTIWECYRPNQPAPATNADGKSRVQPDFCGWSALGPISLFIENVVGIYDVDALAREVRWNLPNNVQGSIGVRRLRFGDIVCDLICSNGEVSVSSSGAFTLWINGRRHSIRTGSVRWQ